MTSLWEWLENNKTTLIVVLAVTAALLLGTIIGVLLGRGADDQRVAVTTTVAPPPTTTQPTAVTTTVPTSGELTILASEDTYVSSIEPGEINGDEESLEVENDPPETQWALIRFRVVGVPAGKQVSQAILRLVVDEETDDAVTVNRVIGDWSEAATTWSNAPSVGSPLAVIEGGSFEGSVVEVDVTEAVRGDGQVDFYLITGSDDTAGFASTESGNGPVLVVRWGDEVAGDGPADPEVPVVFTGPPVLMAGAGDIADCAGDGAAVTAGLVDGGFPEGALDIVFTLGDNVYPNGSSEEFAGCYQPSWGGFKDKTRPAAGERDYATPEAAGYFGYFGEAAGSPDEGYYTYEVPGWRVIVLNSNCSEVGGCEVGSPQERWLRQVLALNSAQCILAYWHSPLLSSGPSGGDPAVRPLFQALYDFGAEVVINGHDHAYERFALQNPDGIHDPVSGIRQFTVGTGGASLDQFGKVAANSEVRFNEGFGVLLLKLYEGGYEWEYVVGDGSDFTDVGVGVCG